jgi:hypothetical protein
MAFQTLHFPVLAAVGPICSMSADGRRVNRMVQALLNQGYSVKLDFHGVKLLTPSFYEAALGELQASFPDDRVSAVNLPDTQDLI